MNKFIAMLRDSYKEAVSGWMLQVMLVFAVLLMVFIASIGFRPMSMGEFAGRPLQLINRGLPSTPDYAKYGSPVFGVENYKAGNESEPWNGTHEFDFVITCPDAASLEKYKDEGRMRQLPVSRAGVERFVKVGYDILENVTVKPVNSTPEKLVFKVTAEKTKIREVREWPHVVSILYAFEIPLLSPSLRVGVYYMLKWLVNGAGAWILLAVSIIVTAGFIPNMLSKGTIDLVISKPISRPFILVSKYLGGMTFIAILTTFTALGVWLVVGVRTGMWLPSFLLIIPILILYFGVLYAASTLVAVFTRNSLVAILATMLTWVMFWGIGKFYDEVREHESEKVEIEYNDLNAENPVKSIKNVDPDAPLWDFYPRSLFIIPKILHAGTPRTYQLDSRMGRIIASAALSEREVKKKGYGEEPTENWPEMLGVSGFFIMFCLAMGSWRMVTRDG
ncbi:MAG: ABC transporter permease [Fimbriiglobus sp.]